MSRELPYYSLEVANDYLCVTTVYDADDDDVFESKSSGNYFETEEEAQAALDRIRELLTE